MRPSLPIARAVAVLQILLDEAGLLLFHGAGRTQDQPLSSTILSSRTISQPSFSASNREGAVTLPTTRSTVDPPHLNRSVTRQVSFEATTASETVTISPVFVWILRRSSPPAAMSCSMAGVRYFDTGREVFFLLLASVKFAPDWH